SEVYTIEAPNLVEAIEAGDFDSKTLDLVLPLKILEEKEVDTLALGCTHFPLVSSIIKEALSDNILVLDSGEAIARQVKRVLEANDEIKEKGSGKTLFYTTKDNQGFIKMIEKYLGENNTPSLLDI
ncbi:MAG: hypothetical protein R3251_04715, partial [Candidatus Spechtbacterales bacterium]|nr:hypothetical protein [Candidatus Spechtbacterales bacterium]